MKRTISSFVVIVLSICAFSGWANPTVSFSASNALQSKKAVKVSNIRLNKYKATIRVGKTIKLKATIYPKNATNKKITWKSNKKSVATVKKGIVRAKAKGKAIITAKTSNGKMKKCIITVKAKSPYAKPYKISAMKADLIKYGKSIGMTHITHFPEEWGGGQITPDGTTWLPPHETWMYDSSSASKLKQDLCDRIKRWKNEGEKTFTLWFEKDNKHSGDYIIYVIIA